MDLINDLRAMGAEVFVELPSVAVIGGQSAGKSSLVEAVSGINVPRDSGTCTRCPMECTMSSAGSEWSCTISIRTDYDSNGRPLPQSHITPFGKPLTNKSDVDIWLRRAQTAVLNPSDPPERFYQKNYQELKDWSSPYSLKFSRNVVCVSIVDPDATDLSFIDLPGLVQNEDDDIIDLVRKLAETYIQKDKTIILTTIPMTDDIENQQSVRLARAADGEGRRTIGVLTKPDMLHDGAIGARRKWKDVLEGRSHRLRHGYYCMRFPDDAEREAHITRAEAQRRATEFFDRTSPWCEIADRARFGVPGFVNDVSKLLCRLIEDSLPNIRSKVDELFRETTEDMNALPKPPSMDARIEVLTRINNFCERFKEAVYGTSQYRKLAQRNRAVYAVLKPAIRGTAPDFRPFSGQVLEYIPVEDIKQVKDDVSWTTDSRVIPLALFDIRKVIHESTAWELPGNVPFEAKANLIRRFISLWETHANACFTSICEILDSVAEEFIEEHFGRFKVLANHVRNCVAKELNTCIVETRQAVKDALAQELSPSFTQDTLTYNELRAAWLSHYRSKYNSESNYHSGVAPQSNQVQPVSDPLQAVVRSGFEGLSSADVAKLVPGGNFEDELVVMADVRAYFQVAYKRIIDRLPLTIEHTLHRALSSRLSQSLLTSVMGTSDFTEKAERLVSEDPAIATRRTALETRMQRLIDIKVRLSTFAF